MSESVQPSGSVRLLTSLPWFAALNAVFLIAYPAWGLPLPPMLQSLAINFVLFIAPGLGCAVRGRAQRASVPLILLQVLLVSFVTFIGALGLCHVSDWAVTPPRIWNITWIASNLLLFGAFARCFRHSPLPFTAHHSPLALSAVLFAAAYGLYFYGATEVVPPQPDHDLEVQGTGYALLDRMEPLLLTDRGTYYYFAHPLMLHYYAAASFLYYGTAEELKPFDDVSQRVRAARRGEEFVPYSGRFGEHQVVGLAGTDYVLRGPDSRLLRTPFEILELELIDSRYASRPHKLETRTPTIFLAAITVALLGWWSTEISGRWWIGLLAAAYMTGPEVFVRSSYGGYFGITNFAALMILMAAADSDRMPASRPAWWSGLLAGSFAALANHKLILLPAALNLALVIARLRTRSDRQGWLHPAMTGFAVGTALFWAYGFLIDADAFWKEHIRTHLIDRVAHLNPLGYTGYPNVTELWAELSEHTGYILLPAGAVALLLSLAPARWSRQAGLPPMTLRSWLAWFALTAIVFSAVDWRMTKHLMPLLIVLHLAPVVWTSAGRIPRAIIAVLFLCLLAWNVWTLGSLIDNFTSFTITPAW